MILIAHAAWATGRRESLRRLLDQVPRAEVVTSTEREHASVWAPRLWRRALELAKPYEWCTFLNDDVTLTGDVHHCLATVSGECDAVSLATIQPEAPAAYAAGKRWLASYCATGPGYSIRASVLASLIEFHSRTLTNGMRARMNEDEVLSHWAWARQKPFWHCLPALVKHDVSIPSTLGYDNHPSRIATVLDDIKPWPDMSGETPDYVSHPWMGEGRMRAVRRACTNGWDFDDICVFCAKRPVLIQSPTTGAGICGQCASDAVGHVLINARIA